jgi:hypothetical protein
MRVAICQPTYLPWLGYFDLIDQVDTFVFLDTVQFERQSWQQRNRIKTPTGLQWLTVPVLFRGKLDQKICDVEIRTADFVEKHARALEVNYSRAHYFKSFFPELSSILRGIQPGARLAELNVCLLQWFMSILKINTPLMLASSMNEAGKRTGLLANICRRLGAGDYLSPIGSAEYLLSELALMNEANIETHFQHYVHPQYEQRFPPFIPYASIVDLVFNEGDRAMEIIRSGRRTPLTPVQVAANVAEVREA